MSAEWQSKPDSHDRVIMLAAQPTRVEIWLSLMCSAFFILSGIGVGCGVEPLIAKNPQDAAAIKWFYVLSLLAIVVGVAGAAHAIREMVRRIQYVIDASEFVCVEAIGFLKRRRQWSRDDVAFVKVRDLYKYSWREVRARIELVLIDGQSISISPVRPRSILQPIFSDLDRALAPKPDRFPDELQPLGSNIVIRETPSGVSIVAKPILPQNVPGNIHSLGIGLAAGSPAMGLWVGAIIRGMAGHDFFRTVALCFGGFVILSFTGAGIWLALWTRRIARTSYEVTIHSSAVTVETINGNSHVREVHNVRDIADVVHTVVFSEKEDETDTNSTSPQIVRLQLIARNGDRTTFLYGRPLDETIRVLNAVRERLGFPTSDLRSPFPRENN